MVRIMAYHIVVLLFLLFFLLLGSRGSGSGRSSLRSGSGGDSEGLGVGKVLLDL